MNSKRINNITDIKLKILSRLKKEIGLVLIDEMKIKLLNEDVDLNDFIRYIINKSKIEKNNINKITLIIENYMKILGFDLDIFKNYCEFKKFLIDNKCYDEFIKNLKKDLFAYTISIDKSNYILLAFIWDATISGSFYWSEMNDKWLTQLSTNIDNDK